MFQLKAPFEPKGDQIKAIEKLNLIWKRHKEQVLLGATGTGKTFTIANIIKVWVKDLIMAPTKTLAGQLYGELKSFFPNNRVEYFISYYDYYQLEAYVVSSDTYIEKDASINDEIDELRHQQPITYFKWWCYCGGICFMYLWYCDIEEYKIQLF